MMIPEPEPGLVVRFNYLWSRDHVEGQEEARYPRPCAVVLSYRRLSDGSLIVLLAPITHSQPRRGDRAIEIPANVKRHLRLDDERSWVILDEVNETGWPGYDLRPDADGRFAYGFLPPRFYERIRLRLLEALRESLLRRVPRG